MKNVRKIILLVFSAFVFACVASSCHSLTSDGRRIEKTLRSQQQEVLTYMDEVRAVLEAHLTDSLLSVSQKHPQIILYVYDTNDLVFWSHNWLVSNNLLRIRYNEWWFSRFENAVGVGRWTKVNDYSVCAIIPLKFAYTQYNDQLPRNFIYPFRAKDTWQLKRQRTNEGCYPVMASDGTYMFSLVPPEEEPSEPLEPMIAPWVDSQSYGTLLASPHVGLTRYRLLVLILVAICVLYVVALVVTLVRNRGWRNMRMYTKVQYFVVALVLLSFGYICVMSTYYVRRQYEQRQQQVRMKKAQYIQAALQGLYFWDRGISQLNTNGLNTDLRDLSYAYETDILVYDLHGRLVGSSAPQLLEAGVISPIIAPEPFFSGKINTVCYEEIGRLRYLTAYTEFYNGNWLPIGYIAVPSYISTSQVEQEVAEYIRMLLPPYVMLLVLAIVLSLFVSQRLARSMRSMADTMHAFQLGKDNYVHYDGNDEVGQLVKQYNAMVRQFEQLTARMAQSERESAWRTMARQVAHEINNTLTPMKLSIQQLQRIKGTEHFDERFDHAARILLEQFDDLGRIATTFSDFAKMPEVHPSEVDIAEKLFSAVTLMRMDSNIPIRYVGPEIGVQAYADAEQVAHVFTNIIKNALQAMQGRAHSDIIVVLKEAMLPTKMQQEKGVQTGDGTAKEKYVEISISDNGPGIPANIQDKIFMPNFTTKSTGMGLGLAITKNIVDGSEGYITFETSKKGTTFYIYFKKIVP